MAIRNEREYRNIGVFDATSDFIVEGYASTFDSYPLFEEDGKVYSERIDRHAFDEADMSDVVFLRDHAGRVLARTKNGKVQLEIDDKGLKTRTDLSLTGASKEMYEDIQAGNYTQMSFSFVVAEDHYDKDTRTRVIDRIKKLYDVSAVAFPANPWTDIGVSMRDYFDGVIEAERAERLEAEKRAREIQKLKLKIKLMEVKR